MNKIKLLIVIGTLLVALPGLSFAERNAGKLFEECGIGGLLFENIPVAAIISNIIWDLGTTAISSHASKTCRTDSAQLADFIYESYVNLEEETVQGEGAHLQALLSIAHCGESARPALIQSIRADFSKSLSAEGYLGQSRYSKSVAFYSLIQARVGSSSSCQIGS